MSGKVEYCEKCHRIIGIGCACGLTITEKAKSVNIDKHSLLTHDKQLRGQR